VQNRPKPKRIIGIDFGMARLGIAYSDESQTIASPLKVIQAEKKSIATVAKVVKELQNHQAQHHYDIEEIVVGLPLLMSGKVGLLADEVKNFVKLMLQMIPVSVITWDERLTSVQAERSMRETKMSRKRRSQVIDIVAAVIILQNYLDHKKEVVYK
jgi:putative holliday junction resolvase